jgi:hypothetical protein
MFFKNSLQQSVSPNNQTSPGLIRRAVYVSGDAVVAHSEKELDYSKNVQKYKFINLPEIK